LRKAGITMKLFIRTNQIHCSTITCPVLLEFTSLDCVIAITSMDVGSNHWIKAVKIKALLSGIILNAIYEKMTPRNGKIRHLITSNTKYSDRLKSISYLSLLYVRIYFTI
jgi:hypothetical protein